MNTHDPLSCRWKQLRGSGRTAVYRATCGRSGCPGHLGDLSYFSSLAEEVVRVEEAAQRERRELERAVAHGQSTPDGAALRMRETEATLEGVRRLRDREAAVGVPASGNWCIQQDCQVAQENGRFPMIMQPIYYGHADTGYRISQAGKRSRRGYRVGRRPDARPGRPTALLPLLADFDDSRGVDGQDVRLPARIWCPVCGTLNRLAWPEALQDPQAR